MFGRCVSRCTNFRFYNLTHRSFIIACFCCNLQTVLKSFNAELIDKVWICDLVKIQAQQAHTTTVVNILSLLPPVKINLTTFRNICARIVTSNLVNFVIFLCCKYVRNRVTLIKQNFALQKFKKMIFCYFQENRSQSNDFKTESRLLRWK